MSSSEIIDHELLATIPRPLARMWRDTTNAANDAAYLQCAAATFELYLRLEVAWGLAVLPCTATREPMVRKLFLPADMPRGGKLSLGHWVDRFFALAQFLARTDDHPLAGAWSWLVKPDGVMDSHLAGLHGEIVRLRNDWIGHNQDPGIASTETRAAARDLVAKVREVLVSAKNLQRYRMLVTRNVVEGRRGLFSGDVDVLVAEARWTRATWTHRLVQEGDTGALPVFLVPPDGRAAVDLFPFVALSPNAERQTEDVGILSGFDTKSGGVRVRFRHEQRTLHCAIPEVGSSLEAWLNADRAHHLAAHVLNPEPKPPFVHPVPEIPDQVGRTYCRRYEVLEAIGSGSTATVYKVRCHLTRKTFALKVLKEALLRDHDIVERFKREFEVANRLGHPGIVRDLELDRDAETGHWVMRMELLDGGTLRDRIGRGPSSVHAVLDAAAAALSALVELHQTGIVHRDIKPANFLFGRNDQMRLSDFGAALVADDRMTRTVATIGTLAYMAPEASDSANVTPRSDIYSLAKVLTELALGRELSHVDRPGDGLQGTLAELLTWMGARDPGQRPDAREALLKVAQLRRQTAKHQEPDGVADARTPPSAESHARPTHARGITPPTAARLPQGPTTPKRPAATSVAIPPKETWRISDYAAMRLESFGARPTVGSMTIDQACRVAAGLKSIREPFRAEVAAWMVLAARVAHRANARTWCANLATSSRPRIHVGGLHVVTVHSGTCRITLDADTLRSRPQLDRELVTSPSWREATPSTQEAAAGARVGEIFADEAGVAIFEKAFPALEMMIGKAAAQRIPTAIHHSEPLRQAIGALCRFDVPRPGWFEEEAP